MFLPRFALIICIVLHFWLTDGKDSDNKKDTKDKDDMMFIKEYDEKAYQVACDAMTGTDPTQYKLDLTDDVSMEDALRMTFWNKGKTLTTNMLDFPEDIQWKRTLVNLLFSIFKDACPDLYVSHEYINVMREFAMIYINSVEPRDTANTDVWNAITTSLEECDKKDLPTHNFTSSGLMITQLITPGDSGPGEIVKPTGSGPGDDDSTVTLTNLVTQKETADTSFELDIIIDNLWTVFSHAWGRCYSTAPSKELWGPRFKRLFFREFMAPLEDRWKNPGALMLYLETIMGDIDVGRMQYNIPYCLAATYYASDLGNVQLIRPIRLAEPEDGISVGQNHKLFQVTIG